MRDGLDCLSFKRTTTVTYEKERGTLECVWSVHSSHDSEFDFVATHVVINQSAEAVTDRGSCCNYIKQDCREVEKMLSSLQMRLKRHSVSLSLPIDIGLIYWQTCEKSQRSSSTQM